MARVAPHIPADTDLLCESCGYILNGLPSDSRCPECGQNITESLPETRQPALIEQGDHFLKTSGQVLFQPSRFYRHLATRHKSPQQRLFARIYWIVSSLLLGMATHIHTKWYSSGTTTGQNGVGHVICVMVLAIAIYLLILAVNLLAARLSAWEARYRGLRLSYPMVLRGLCFHSVHYVPVALLFLTTTAIYRSIPLAESYYLYSLCAEVVLCAGYLFWTYWIAMRNMLYANR